MELTAKRTLTNNYSRKLINCVTSPPNFSGVQYALDGTVPSVLSAIETIAKGTNE